MALILLVNLAFSIVGFFTIFRMWREVKSRRDYYGEHFEIPRGIDRTKKRKKHAKRHEDIEEYEEPESQSMSMDDIEAMVAARLEEERRREEQKRRELEERERQERQREIEEQERQERQREYQEQGDLQRMIAAAVAEQMEGRSA